MANSKNSAKVLAAKPQRGMKTNTVQHSVGYDLTADGLFERVAQKGNSTYRDAERFVPANPDYQSGVTQNVGNPVQSDGLRGAISLIRGK
jgi:hypothetical protein